jgi:hypothetical protein
MKSYISKKLPAATLRIGFNPAWRLGAVEGAVWLIGTPAR